MLVIFDWDGTLLNSADKIVRCMQASIRELGLPERSDLEIREIIGLGLPEAIAQLFGPLREEQLLSLRQTYAGHYVAADRTPCEFFPGVLDTLEQLRGDGHQLAVATGKSRRGLERVLESLSLQDFFHASRCADETRSKPDPLMLHELLDETGFTAADAVMVGDTEFDMAMARNAGVRRVAVSYGAHGIDRLRAYDPVLCLDRFSDLHPWVRNVCRSAI